MFQNPELNGFTIRENDELVKLRQVLFSVLYSRVRGKVSQLWVFWIKFPQNLRPVMSVNKGVGLVGLVPYNHLVPKPVLADVLFQLGAFVRR